MQRLSHARPARVAFTWNGHAIEGREGDTVGAALHAASITTLGRSRKHHRPIGLSGSFVSGSLATVDTRPNVRLDREPLAAGLTVRMQNTWPSADLNLLSLARLLPARMTYAGFEHTNLMPSGTRRFEVWEKLLRFMAGVADAPSAPNERTAPKGARVAVDTVVVAGGPAGRIAASAAAQRGERVMLISRGSTPGESAARMVGSLPELDHRVETRGGLEAFGIYRDGAFVAAAPLDGRVGALVIAPKKIVLATGRRSCPPLMPGADLPGVMDAATALSLAVDCAVAPGMQVAVIGTGAEIEVARRLRDLGVHVVATAPTQSLRRITGHNAVTGIETDRLITCDALVHAGPWRPDPALAFMAGCDGLLQLRDAPHLSGVSLAGGAGDAAEPIILGPGPRDAAFVCPCMDVTVAEILHHVRRGETDVEVLKRLTACGMGPCQGVPCWDQLAALLAEEVGGAPADYGHPTYRGPRRGLTVAQAAGLDGLVEPDR
ncbi:MAG: 2Fe-2S iron-sulfur cluster-binding protein [Alphaproteobacteria bacterium]|nr:2Fe-2S iron-sulfur cluster-binding protein [Alphaproteobacteria bacterium]